MCGGSTGRGFVFLSFTTTHLSKENYSKNCLRLRTTSISENDYDQFFTLALCCDYFLLWQRDASPAGTDVFSGQSIDAAVSFFHSQVLSPVQKCVQDSALALTSSHLELEKKHELF